VRLTPEARAAAKWQKSNIPNTKSPEQAARDRHFGRCVSCQTMAVVLCDDFVCRNCCSWRHGPHPVAQGRCGGCDIAAVVGGQCADHEDAVDGPDLIGRLAGAIMDAAAAAQVAKDFADRETVRERACRFAILDACAYLKRAKAILLQLAAENAAPK